MKKLLIEGWRRINHSYALVNQNQLLELIKCDFDLYHHDLPYYRPDWKATRNSSGFSDECERNLNSIKSPGVEDLLADITYRISFPYRYYPVKSGKLFVFGTSEYQTIDGYVYENNLKQGLDNSELKIITPSCWSQEGFVNAGFDLEKIIVVPHGVSEVYKPINSDRKESFRRAMGCSASEFLFLSMGAMTQNKGVDLLILAYSLLKEKYPHARLVLKDSNDLYGIRAKDVFYEVQKNSSRLLTQEIYNSIIFISDNLTQSQLNGLYGSCDCYVSPYRAEGFNLGPLEAAASGIQIIVTDGGATDDYFDSSFGMKIEGRKTPNGRGGFCIEPSLDSLLEKLTLAIESRNLSIDSIKAQKHIQENFSWDRVVKKLIKVFKEN
jgi:glycosyltransferase involved in cell wall biosynthesis